MNDVQALVDGLAGRLGRPVGVDDRRFRAVAYSAHHDEIDVVRRTSILGRQAPGEVVRWLNAQGVSDARTVVRIPARPDLGMVARACCPLRFDDHLLGFLWLAEHDRALTDEELDLGRRCAADLAQELYRVRQQESEERRHEARWVRAVLGGETPDGDLGASRGIAEHAEYAAVVVQVGVVGGRPMPSGVDVRLTEAVDRQRRAVPPRHQLADVRVDEAAIVIAVRSAEEARQLGAALLEATQAELAGAADDAVRVLVGVGDVVGTVAGLAASAAHARLALRTAASMPEFGPLASWSELGVMQIVAELVGERAPASLIPQRLRRLLGAADGPRLALTLERYLEAGGDAAEAAAELYVHRSSMYNRLRRIEQIAGVDLRSGADRLELQLGLRLWRMSGVPDPDGADGHIDR